MGFNEQAYNEIQDAIDDVLEDAVNDALDNAMDDFRESMEEVVTETVSSSVENAVRNIFSDLEFIFPDGTHVIPREKMRLSSPDKTRVLLCYGGLRVEDTGKFGGNCYPIGWALSVQTRIDCWDVIYVYPTKTEAVAALEKVNEAIISGAEFFEL